MFKKSRFVVAGTVIFSVGLLLLSLVTAQEKMQPEEYQAQAMGQGTQLGQTFNVTVNLDLNKENPKNNTGVLLPACQFKIDKKTKELEIENYQNPWKLVDVLDRSKR